MIKIQEQKYKSLEECVSKLGRGNYIVIKPYKLPLKIDGRISEFDITYFEFGAKEQARRYIVISKGSLEDAIAPYVRINSECMWGRLESAQCDCEWQFKESKKIIDREGIGMVILGVDQIGKSVGLKVHSLINAEAHLENPDIPLHKKDIWYKGFIKYGGKVDYRSFDDYADILSHYNIRSVRLLTNNLDKINGLEKYGIKVERVPFEAPATKFNRKEYEIKQEKGGHLLKIEPSWKRNIKKYTMIGVFSLLSAALGAGVIGGYQYHKAHRFDNVNAGILETYKPHQFRNYIINGPEEGSAYTHDLFDQKWIKINDYLRDLERKDRLSEGDIEKLRCIIENPNFIIQMNIIKAVKILTKNKGDVNYLESLLLGEGYKSETYQELQKLIPSK